MPNGAFNSFIFLTGAAGGKTNVLASILPLSGAMDLPWASGANNTEVGPNGNLNAVAANVPPFDFSEGCVLAVVDPDITNEALDSTNTATNFTTGANLTLSLGVVLGGDAAVLTADATGNISNASEQHSRVISAAYTAGEKITFSFAVKKTGSHARAGYLLKTASQEIGAWFDVDALSSGSIIETVGVTSRSRKITYNERDDSYLCEETLELTGNETFTLYALAPTDNSGVVSLGNEIAFGFPQLEDYSAATSRVLTTTAPVPRTGGSFSKSGINAYLNDQEMTIFLRAYVYDPNIASQYIDIHGGNSTNRISLVIDGSSGDVSCTVVKGGATQAVLNGGSPAKKTLFTLVAKLKTGDMKLWINGTLVESSTSGEMFDPGTLTDVASSLSGGSFGKFRGKIQLFGWAPVALGDAQCQELSNYSQS